MRKNFKGEIKMKLKKLLSVALLASLAMTSLVGCGAPKEEGKDEQKAIVVGTNPTFAPFEFQDKEGNMTGFDLDLMTAIGEDQGFQVEFKSMEFDALTGALATGQIDVAAAGISVTPERNEKVLFSDPYMNASLGIVVTHDNKDIVKPEDLKDKVVCAQIGTTGAEAASALKEDGIVKEVKLLSDFNVCVQEILNGGSDACINDMPVNLNYIAAHPNDIKVLDDLYATDYYAITVAKDAKELQEKINAGLKNLIKNGKYEELCKKYDLPVSPDVVNGEITIAKILELKK